MSKTVQRKRSYLELGISDYNTFGLMFMPFHSNKSFNNAYKKGFVEARINDELSENKTLLNWFRTKFHM